MCIFTTNIQYFLTVTISVDPLYVLLTKWAVLSRKGITLSSYFSVGRRMMSYIAHVKNFKLRCGFILITLFTIINITLFMIYMFIIYRQFLVTFSDIF